MKPRSAAAIVLGIALACLGPWGCGDSDHPHAEDSHAAGGHAHEPKYGGKLIELGEHEGNVELVLDPAAGKLTLYVLDAHAENFVRLPLETISVTAEATDGPKTLVLKPVANPVTGETPGNTSQFEGVEEWLKTSPKLTGRIPELPVKSKTYRDIAFQLP
ncbi:MAG: hypothetical protein KIT22_09660 [Verrucomicrobiae bacterium]|nr:hypothetical protein [Verrucomicrobiae bacterium]